MIIAVGEMRQVRHNPVRVARRIAVVLVTRIRCVVIVLARRTGRRVGRIGSVSTTRRNNPGYMIIRVVQVVNIIGILVGVVARRRVVIRMTSVGVAVMVLPRGTPRVLSRGSSRPSGRGRRRRSGSAGVVAAQHLACRAGRRRVVETTASAVSVLSRRAGRRR